MKEKLAKNSGKDSMAPSHIDGTKSVSYKGESLDKTKEFLSSQVPETPEKINTISTEKVDEKAMENAVRENLLKTYPKEEPMTPVIKNRITGNNRVVTAEDLFKKKDSFPQKVKKFLSNLGKYTNTRNLKRLVMASAFLGSTSAAMSQQGPNVNQKADADFAKTYALKGNEANKITSYGDAKKVSSVPFGYVMDKTEGDKTYYKKTTDGKEKPVKVRKAISGGPVTPEDGIKQENWLIEQLKSGVSPEDLVKNGHASPEGIKKYLHFYVPSAPSVDVVYTEKETSKEESDPFAAFSKMGEVVYGPNQHIAAEMFYPTRNTKSITDPGNLNTSVQDVLFRVRDDWGFKKQFLIMKSGDIQHYLGSGKQFQSEDKFKEFLEKAEVFTNNYNNNKETNYKYSPEDLAKGTDK